MNNFQSLPDLKVLVVLGHSNEKNKSSDDMTLDATARTHAAGHIFAQKKIDKIILLGGGNDKLSRDAEAEKMRSYLKKKFSIAEAFTCSESQGTNTLENVANVILRCKNDGVNRSEVAFITSGYNTVRLNLVLEILGWPNALVLSAERILMGEHDGLARELGVYTQSMEYQNRLAYEAYWTAKTVYDEEYTKDVRQKLGIKKTPIEYFKEKPLRKMESL